MIAIEPTHHTNRMTLSLLVGLLAGLGFAFGAWGMEGIALFGAHAMFPFLKFAAGAVLCGLVGLLAGFLSRRFVHIFANVLIWAAAAVAFNRIAIYISFPGMQTMLGWFDPSIQSLVNYPIDYGVSTRATLMLVIMLVAGALAGLFANSTVEEASASEGVQRWISLLFWMGAFIGVGYLFSALDTQPLRNAVVKVDQSIEFSIEHAGEDLSNEVKSQMGQFGLKAIEPFIGSPYRLIASGYDQMLAFIKVLVLFEDQRAICPVINEIMGTCTLLES
jgi:hypothetical protein